jgi:hypothetical protein
MNYTPDMSRESVERAIYHALLIWSYPSQLRFRLANDLEHPDIEFLFAQGYHKDGYQFDGKGLHLNFKKSLINVLLFRFCSSACFLS